jgi:hypothetical protein
MSNRFPNRSGVRSLRALALLALLPLSGCIYSFTGGGLPSHIRTVAVLPFENNTTQPLLQTDIQQALQKALPGSLGVRIADQSVADAVVRGTVTRFEEAAASVRPTAPGESQIPVVQRQIQISYDAEIYDLREDRPIWQGKGQSVVGNYQPESEEAAAGITRAIQQLVAKVIEGAQSQW